MLERTAARSPLGTTLADLGTESLRLTTGATAYVGIRQDTFGTPLSALDLHLVGTHSAVPEDGPETRLDAYLNGALVDSVTLGEEPELELDLHVEGASLAAENGLELVLRSAGGCDAMPAEVSIDGAASTVQATAGSSGARGLQRFPQVLGGDLPVAVGSEAGLESAAVVDAAALVVALQRAAARPIDVRLVPVADLLDGGRAGLLVAAGGAETRRLGASLQLEQVRVLADGAERLEVDSDQPYAALQAVTDGGREVLVLGGWSPPDEAGRSLELTARTARWVAARGWGAVGADYVVTDAAGEVSLVRSETVVPQDGVVEERGDAAWWLVGGVGALLVALVAGAVVHGRRQGAVRELVRAQNDEDAHRDRP